eukprot:jgi/Galph1/3456/GphlegSOOS_G2107.1
MTLGKDVSNKRQGILLLRMPTSGRAMAANGRLNRSLSDTSVNRVQAVLQVLEAFRHSYVQSDQTLESTARPVVCFSGHMCGAGKTTLGKHFYQFLLRNRQYIRDKLGTMNFPGCRTSEEGLDTLYNGTLYVYLELGRFPKEGHRFEYVLHQKICETALSDFPSGNQLLSEVLPLVPKGPSGMVSKTFSSCKQKSPSPGQSSSNVYRLFFRLLRPLLVEPFVLCIVVGRCDAIVHPFSSDIVNDIVQQSRYGEETLREIIFPKTPQGIDWLSDIVWDIRVVRVGKDIVSNPKWKNLSKDELEKKPELFVSLPNMRPKTVAVFSSMLLPSALEITLRPEETYFSGMNLGLYSTYALDIASSFGFYYSYGESTDTFKLVYPKIVLKYLETRYDNTPVFRFISHLVSTTTPSNSPVSRELTFQVLFSLVLYFKLYFCSKLGEINIFQKTFIEDYRFDNVDYIERRKCIPLPQYVASFSSTVWGEATATGLTYHPNAWNLFYEDSYPEKMTFSPSQVTDSTQLVTFSSQEGPIVYLIGISLNCYHLAGQGVGLSLIKNETEKFLIPVAQQLDLKAKNMAIIQVIVSTKYTKEVTRQFTDHQNWTLNSGIYYENDNGHICLQSLSSPPACDSCNEWLIIPSRCQLVVCSATSWQSFLGREAYSELGEVFVNEDAIQSDSKLFPLSSTLTIGVERERNIRRSSHANAIQVEYTREAQVTGALKRCSFSEASMIERYTGSLRVLTPISFPYLKDQWLFSLGIEPQDVPIRLKVIGEYLNERENSDSLNL